MIAVVTGIDQVGVESRFLIAALTIVIAIVSVLFIRAQNAAERKERAGL